MSTGKWLCYYRYYIMVIWYIFLEYYAHIIILFSLFTRFEKFNAGIHAYSL